VSAVGVPFVDLKAQLASIRSEIDAALKRVLETCTFVLGPEVAAFEENFAKYCGVEHCIGVSSGTAALHLALLAAGVGPGDEVITVSHTFIATAWAISYLGARPVFVDIDPETYTLSPASLERAFTPRTKAVLPVHLYGQPADLDPLLEICGRHGVPLVEDCAQSQGAKYHGRRVGGFGLLAATSFYPGKNLGAYGEAGAVLTRDASLARRVRALRDHAQTARYLHSELGFNYRMAALQGAVLDVKLAHLDSWNQARRRAAKRYQTLLSSNSVGLPKEAEGLEHVWHLYVVRHLERDRLKSHLDEAGVGNGLHYPTPVHLQPAYAELGYRRGDLPVTEQVARECLSLPMYAELDESLQRRVAESLRQFEG
jgi:dTDP-4-amino-4,6-dideoxygalactose transaminase